VSVGAALIGQQGAVVTTAPDAGAFVRRETVRLQSLSGTAKTITFDGDLYRLLLHTGLGNAPVSVLSTGTHDYDGSTPTYVRGTERAISLTWRIEAEDPDVVDELYQALRDLVSPVSVDGSRSPRLFRIWADTLTTSRYIDVVYTGGLEGSSDEHPHHGRRTGVLSCTAYDPWARDRTPGSLPFPLVSASGPWTSNTSGNGWPRRTARSVIRGNQVIVIVRGNVNTYATVTVTGPLTSLSLSFDSGLVINVPAGLATGEVLKVVTGQYGKSITVNGVPAANRLALTSRLKPLRGGSNLLTLEAPGATQATQVLLEWENLLQALL
jgi:hypothetical protein